MVHKKEVNIIEEMMLGFAHQLIFSDEDVTGQMAETNCTDWDWSDTQNLKAWFNGDGKIRFSAKLRLTGGDPYPDGSFCGSEIEVDVQGDASTSRNESQWKIQNYKILNASITDF